MSARQKLNQLHATGAAVVAGMLGLAFQSWWAFVAFLLGLLGLGVWGGSIRLTRRFAR
ncbi:hypothetical protein [Urbifossiella limnaea]|uniref:Uncharacterized protein n=1 Tax=Urbifossiella limnaea TaxID=2528023 RepID=A0A517XPJ1_9BACT|nr:hypothetical protein [Urbifossiella limnaea]QDU19423.1 hypothetical protein ETAA1_13470 [Urbifossiella limnaea]